MKRIYFLSLLFFTGSGLYAQKPATPSTLPAAPTLVAKTGDVTGFTANLAEGRLTLTKAQKKDNSGNFVATYYILDNNNRSFNAGNAFEIKLTKESFTDYFQKSSSETAQKWDMLMRYAQDKKLSFTEEKGWAALIGKYNNFYIN